MAVVCEQLDGYAQWVVVEETKKAFVGDEPESLGGENLGPNPFALLLASVGTCTITTLEAVAREKNIPLDGARVSVTHRQNLVVDAPEDPRQRQLHMTKIVRRITVRGPIDEQQQKELLWGAEHCPVSNTLRGGTAQIETTLELARD